MSCTKMRYSIWLSSHIESHLEMWYVIAEKGRGATRASRSSDGKGADKMKVRWVFVITTIIEMILVGIALNNGWAEVYFDGKVLFISLLLAFGCFVVVGGCAKWDMYGLEMFITYLQGFVGIYVFFMMARTGAVSDNVLGGIAGAWIVSMLLPCAVLMFTEKKK